MIRPTVLIAPGLGNSGPQHWQSLWQAKGNFRRLQQDDWNNPDRESWINAMERAVSDAPPPAVLVAHSLACIAAVHWSTRPGMSARKIASALLVAPADVEADTAPPVIGGFAPIPLRSLPFPATVVASRTDPYCSFERARVFATRWGAGFVDAGNAGHINVESGHGDWPEGRHVLDIILGRVRV